MLPILYQSPELTLYSYPLLMGFGWGVAYQIFFGLESESVTVKQKQFLFWGIFIFAWLGAKAFFYFTLPADLSENLLTRVSFWTGGGLVFYGGFLGALLFLLLYRTFGFPLGVNHLWPMVPALTFGHAIGRVGCLLAGCCFGHHTDWWWGIHMHGEFRHPTQLIEALGLFILGAYLLRSSRSKISLLGIYLTSYGVLRFGVELLRGDEIRGQWGPLTPSQWISLFLFIGGALILVKKQVFKTNLD